MLLALLGGALIGLAASIALLAHGRVAGISGTVGRLFVDDPDDGRSFRIAFLVGLLGIAALAALLAPRALGTAITSTPILVVAGLLVGIGTTLANGCTSGHGVCGLSRGSTRSLAAVITFMGTAAITVAVARGLA